MSDPVKTRLYQLMNELEDITAIATNKMYQLDTIYRLNQLKSDLKQTIGAIKMPVNR